MSPMTLLSLPNGTFTSADLHMPAHSPQGERGERRLVHWGVALACVALLVLTLIVR